MGGGERKKERKKRKEEKTERASGVGRRTREEIVNWNQMTARRFQTGRRHQISTASLRGDVIRINLFESISLHCLTHPPACLPEPQSQVPSAPLTTQCHSTFPSLKEDRKRNKQTNRRSSGSSNSYNTGIRRSRRGLEQREGRQSALYCSSICRLP